MMIQKVLSQMKDMYISLLSLMPATQRTKREQCLHRIRSISGVTNRWLALPIFALVMFIVYYVSVTTVGAILTDWTNETLFAEWIVPGVQISTGICQLCRLAYKPDRRWCCKWCRCSSWFRTTDARTVYFPCIP